MDDEVFNAMTDFQFFCNNYFKQKNIDKLVPKNMLRSDWKIKKEEILNEEVANVNLYLDQQASLYLQTYNASTNKPDIEKRFAAIITKAIDSYKLKLKEYYLY